MVHVASEMERQGFEVPLLIGGATTSRVHTAVKIEPHYAGPTVWVPDASRSVGVCTSLVSDELKADYVRKAKLEHERTRQQHKGKKGQGPHHPIGEARKHGLKTDSPDDSVDLMVRFAGTRSTARSARHSTSRKVPTWRAGHSAAARSRCQPLE